MKTSFLAIAATMLGAVLSAAGADNLKAFPTAGEGMVRHVFHLPAREVEADAKVELIVGKTVELDAGNRYFFGGTIETKTIEGWGFTSYHVSALGRMAGTLMAVDPAVPKVPRFITLGGEPYLIRYNSKLPVVVYVPQGGGSAVSDLER